MTRTVRGLVTPASLGLLLAGCSDTPSPAERYREGYRYGRDEIPDGHVDDATSPADTAGEAGADAECGEHAETDGIEPFPPSEAWTAGCRDGARGLPPSWD
ncbi:hypothetical protein [Streptomyces sp. NPDC002889]|uniref:hypothetical protein n=1 Tax=Streptomyces sp. NPDC002889 TaxID=3364669 RepID=UPI0036CD15B3